MNGFVEECLREWKRLGVADPVAREMAADLEADLREAEAEGASAEDVLGQGAFDPRAFAAAWATERGVIGRPVLVTTARRSWLPLAIAAFAAVAIAGAALLIFSSHGGPTRVAFASPAARLPFFEVPRRFPLIPRRLVKPLAPFPGAKLFAVGPGDSDSDAHRLGGILLLVGLAGGATLGVYWLTVRPGRRPRITLS